MTPRVVVLPAADREPDEQAEFLLAHGSLQAATDWFGKAAATFEFLAKNPGRSGPSGRLESEP